MNNKNNNNKITLPAHTSLAISPSTSGIDITTMVPSGQDAAVPKQYEAQGLSGEGHGAKD
jgi:hypothetical protein